MKYVPFYSPADLKNEHAVIELRTVVVRDCIMAGNPTAAYVYSRLLVRYARLLA